MAPVRFPFDNTHARLPERFYARLGATPVAAPRLVLVNAAVAEPLGLDPDGLAGPEGVEVLAGNRVPKGAEPIALACAGHRFGHFVPRLGDGRAILLGEVAQRDGARRDIQLNNQPRLAQRNLARPAGCLLPLLAEDQKAALETAREVLAAFGPRFEAARLGGLRRKIGLSAEREGDAEPARDLLRRMAGNGAGPTLAFRRLSDAAAGPEGGAGVRAPFADAGAFDAWAAGWRRRLAEEPGEPGARRAATRAADPAVIPRNHLVEVALGAAVEREDLGPFEEMLDALLRPYEDGPGERVRQTFRGTCGAPAGTPSRPFRAPGLGYISRLRLNRNRFA